MPRVAIASTILFPDRIVWKPRLTASSQAVNRGVLDGRQAAVDRSHADARTSDRGRGRDGASCGGSRSGSADSGVGADRRTGRKCRRLQRQSREGIDPDRPVLLVQSAQLRRDHSWHRLAVRPDQRWHRARRGSLHRRGLLRTAGRGDARLPRRRAGRGAARTAGNALRQEHDGGCHQRHEPPAELHAREQYRGRLRQLQLLPDEGVGLRSAEQQGRRRACRSPGTGREGFRLQHGHAG